MNLCTFLFTKDVGKEVAGSKCKYVSIYKVRCRKVEPICTPTSISRISTLFFHILFWKTCLLPLRWNHFPFRLGKSESLPAPCTTAEALWCLLRGWLQPHLPPDECLEYVFPWCLSNTSYFGAPKRPFRILSFWMSGRDEPLPHFKYKWLLEIGHPVKFWVTKGSANQEPCDWLLSPGVIGNRVFNHHVCRWLPCCQGSSRAWLRSFISSIAAIHMSTWEDTSG